MGMREEFEKVFPLPKGVYWEDWGNGDGQYEVTVDVDELLADMQQARFQGWQAALTQSEKSAEPEGFDFDGWYDKHQSLFRDGMGKSDLRAAYKQGYRDSQPAQQGVPEETEAMVDAAVKVFEDAGAKVDLGWLGEACRAYVAVSFTPATPQPAQQGSVPEDVIRQCEDAIQYASEIRGGCISGVREAQKRVRAILDTSQPAVPDGEERLTEIYRCKSTRLSHVLNNLRSEYHNRTAELETEIEDLQEELQRVRRQADVPEGWRECLTEMVQAMHDYEMSVDEDAPYKHRAMMDRDYALLSTTPQPEGDGWVKCSERLPTEDDGYVWIYSPDVGVSDTIWQWDDNIGGDSETHWMPTGLKRPQPPQEGDA